MNRLSLIGMLILGGICATAYANEIAINDIAVWSQGSIGLGSGVVINGISASGTVFNANGGSRCNSIYTQGSVWLGSNSVVNGSIYANGSIETYGVNVTGTKNSNWNFVLPQLDALTNTTVGRNSIYRSNNSTTTLNPGDYLEWNFGQKNQLNLSAGSYSISSFYMNRAGVVNVDTSTGDVVLNVNGSFSTGNNVVFNKTGNGNFYVNVINSNMSLGNDVSLSGIVHISGGTFNTPDFNIPLKNCCKSLQILKANLILGVPLLKWDYVRAKKEKPIRHYQRSGHRQIQKLPSRQNHWLIQRPPANPSDVRVG